MGRAGNDNAADSNAAALLNYIEEVTSKCEEEQHKVLTEILCQNAHIEYLKRYGSPTDVETFKSKVPIVSYDDIKLDIQRIADGDSSPILCASPVTEFFHSSGTSDGVQNLIPVNAESMERRHFVYSLFQPVINKYIEGVDKGKALYFLMSNYQKRTPGGLLASPASTAYLRSPYFMDTVDDTFTSPIESLHCFDNFQSMYTQLLCGFYQRHDVVRVGSVFAGTLITIIHFLQNHYSEICHDIASGHLSPKITDPALRARILDTFMKSPNKELAEFINSACKDENWEGIIQKIWPNTKYLEGRATGSMAKYIPTLEYYGGGLPLISQRYGFSECACGVNLNPIGKPYEEASYTLIPTVAYFEFLPIHSEGVDSDQVVGLADVQIGQEYEILVTTYEGLYRYRVEDVLCPTGFYNSTPHFKFVGRKNVVLSIDADKTTESELLKAVESASAILQPFNTMVQEYTSCTDIKTIPGHYVIYSELFSKDSKTELDAEVLEKCCLAMEDTLSPVYRNRRVVNNSIGPLEIRVVKNGSFEKLKEYVLSRGTSLSQYKVPRCLKLLPMKELLDSGVISSHFSPSLPRWDSSDL